MGRMREVLGKLMLHTLRVDATCEIADRFRQITLASPTLRACAPGDKVQLMVPGGTRTYSPVGFDAERGAVALVAYLHGASPGAAWARDAKLGERLRCFGPRGSIALASMRGPIVLVGDETTFGVARSLFDHRRADARASLVFEVTDRAAASAALDALGLPSDGLVQRRDDDAHTGELDARVRAALDAHADAHLVLTGRAGAIQTLRRALKARPAPYAEQKTKAYWAPGKRGLD